MAGALQTFLDRIYSGETRIMYLQYYSLGGSHLECLIIRLGHTITRHVDYLLEKRDSNYPQDALMKTFRRLPSEMTPIMEEIEQAYAKFHAGLAERAWSEWLFPDGEYATEKRALVIKLEQLFSEFKRIYATLCFKVNSIIEKDEVLKEDLESLSFTIGEFDCRF